MVVLTPRFTILAAACSLAAVSLPPSVNGVVIPRHSDKHASDASTSDAPKRQKSPVLPLPAGKLNNAAEKGSTKSVPKKVSKKEKSKQQHKERSAVFDQLNPVARIASLLGRAPMHQYDDDLEIGLPPLLGVEIETRAQQHFFTEGAGSSIGRRHHHDHDRNRHRTKVIVKGDDDHVRVGRHHHDHDYDHHRHTEVIVKGKDDHVRVGRRDPHHHHHNHHHDDKRNDNSNIDAREPHHHHDHERIIVVDGDHEHVRVHRDLSKREQDGVPGTVDIMSTSTKLGSLFMTKSDATTGSEPAFVLNASEANQTSMYLVRDAQSATSNDTSSDQSFVNLVIPVANQNTATMEPWCATFDPSPDQPESMTVEPCFNATQPSTPHKSQTFAYESTNGVVRPMWFAGEDDGMQGDSVADDGSDTDASDASVPTTPDDANVASIAGSANMVRDNAPQNVTLVFVPSAPVAAAEVPIASSSSTATSTTTDTVATTSGSVAAADVTSTLTLVSATASASASVSATPVDSVDSVTGSASASASSAASTSSAASSIAALNVEVVGASSASSTVVTSSVAASSTAPAVATTSAVTSAVDAEAVASSIAESDSSAYSSVVVTTTVTATVTPTAESVETASASGTASAAGTTMTPVSTAPYEWMFKAESQM